MRRTLTLLATLCLCLVAWAQEPMYVVNGHVVDSIKGIPHEDIQSIDVLPADEQTIARWGARASEGVILVTLRYDTPARFAVEGEDNFTQYLARRVKWDDSMPAERVSLRLLVDSEGHATIAEVLQVTSRSFLKRVSKAIASAPVWQPAMRDGEPTESIHLVNLQLPEGKSLPEERGIILL